MIQLHCAVTECILGTLRVTLPGCYLLVPGSPQPPRPLPTLHFQRLHGQDHARYPWMEPPSSAGLFMPNPLDVPAPTVVVPRPRRDEPVLGVWQPRPCCPEDHLHITDPGCIEQLISGIPKNCSTGPKLVA